MHQKRRNNSRWLAYCQEAIRTIDISEEDIGWRRYFRAFLIRRHSLLSGCLRISNTNIISGRGGISVNHFSTVLTSRREDKFPREMFYARQRSLFFSIERKIFHSFVNQFLLCEYTSQLDHVHSSISG